MDSDSETENDKETSENTERNKNIASIDLMTDEEEEIAMNQLDSLEPPVVAVKGTVVWPVVVIETRVPLRKLQSKKLLSDL